MVSGFNASCAPGKTKPPEVELNNSPMRDKAAPTISRNTSAAAAAAAVALPFLPKPAEAIKETFWRFCELLVSLNYKIFPRVRYMVGMFPRGVTLVPDAPPQTASADWRQTPRGGAAQAQVRVLNGGGGG